MISCPLIVYDLFRSSGGVYGGTCAVATLLALGCAHLSNTYPVPVRWFWFVAGSFVSLVMGFLLQRNYKRASAMFRSIGRSKATERGTGGIMQNAQQNLKYSTLLIAIVWPIFPVVFVLHTKGVLSVYTEAAIHAVLDVLAKSLHSLFVARFKDDLLDALPAGSNKNE
jgi:bacteriorhodopsin